MPTFLFTDIEGSTRLWEDHPEAMSLALARHDTIVADAVGDAGGAVLKTTGDGVVAVFDNPAEGMVAAIAIQRGLGIEPWESTGPLRARIGIHTGITETRDGDFFGPVMNRAARIMAAGHGGQVLVSAPAATGLPAESLRDLGLHRLKDLIEPEHLYQLLDSGLRPDFPPPRTLDGRPNNLPQQTTEFLGRASEMAAIQLMLDASTTRLLTIVGPGGVGKTRLGLQVAAEQLDRFPDGVFFVDLSMVRNPDAVFEAIAQVLDVPMSTDNDPVQLLSTRLRDSRILLVLDNFEQVVEAGVGISGLLQKVPGLVVVVTSRETLHVRAEQVFPVPPLSLPDPRGTAQEIARAEAARLFADRARAVRPDFAITAENAVSVAEICLRLDGLPLAIELAAARLNVFTPTELLARIRERLDVLGAGGRDLPDRQRTLWGAIGWSYELLVNEERHLFEALSVFSGATILALEAVTGSPDVVDTVSSLVDKSLVRSMEDAGERRFAMLLMVKEFAASRLAEAPEKEREFREAHAGYFAALAARSKEDLRSDRRKAAIALGSEVGNLETAWEHWAGEGVAERVAEMIEPMWALYESKGWYRAAIELAGRSADVMELHPDLAAEQLAVRMGMARAIMAFRGYGVEAEAAFARALEAADVVGTPAQRFPVLRAMATYMMGTGRFQETTEQGEELLRLGEETGDESMLIEGHYIFGISNVFMGYVETGLRHVDRALELYDPSRHDMGRFRLGPSTGVVARTASGLALWRCGQLEQGIERVTVALEVAREIDHPYSIAYAIHHNGLLALYRSRPQEALEWAEKLAIVAHDNDYPVWSVLATMFQGVAICLLGDPGTGLAMTERGIELYEGITAPPVFWPQLLGLQAVANASAGAPERGLALVEEAIAIDQSSAELRLVKGDILASMGRTDAAGDEYLTAEQGARAWGLRLIELQALIRFVTLCRGQGLEEDGGERLAAVYDGFTEGFDEHDLCQARGLMGIPG